jgi:DNA-binding NarL/FixJ family response regulator
MEQDFTKIGIIIADRLAFFRRGMIGLLQELRPGWQIEEAQTLESVMDSLHAFTPDLILLDLQLPGLGGPEGIRQFRSQFSEARVVVLADTDDRRTILDCLSAGAQGFVLKSATPNQFLRALETILSGGVFAPASLTGPAEEVAVSIPLAMASTLEQNAPAALAMLTDRQRDVFRLLAQGCATKTIARRLNLAVGTVKVHLAAIYRILGAHSRMEAMAKASGGFAIPSLNVQDPARTRERVN